VRPSNLLLGSLDDTDEEAEAKEADLKVEGAFSCLVRDSNYFQLVGSKMEQTQRRLPALVP